MSEPRPPEETTIEELDRAPAYRPVSSPTDATGAVPAGGNGDAGASATRPRRGGVGLRWLLAILGVVVVLAGTALIVSLAGARPAASTALGYMPASVSQYTEIRLDLPGDQRQKLAAFLSAFPGFADQSAVEPKITDVLDRLVRAATKDKQTWSGNIQPWFGGQVGIGQTIPTGPTVGGTLPTLRTGADGLIVATVTDRAKAGAWLTSLDDGGRLTKSTYNGADVFAGTDQATAGRWIVAVTDKVMLAGREELVRAAVDGNGNGALAQDADIKAALATVDRDYVGISVMRLRGAFEGLVEAAGGVAASALASTQLDETILGMIPPWQVATVRFENDSLVTSSAGPSWNLGVEAANRASAVLGHVPANTIAYMDVHDVGPALDALVDKFRALPEAKPFFDQFDQALSLLGGFDAVFGWWGDTAVVVAPGGDGTVGGGLVVHPRDAAAAERLGSTLRGFIGLAGASSGLAARDEDHNGTKITIVDFSKVKGVATSALPPGYKMELAWATNADVTVVGYGRDFVAAVLDAGPGASLADDARFKALLNQVGAENIAASFVDIKAIRTMLEGFLQPRSPGDMWTRYQTDIKPYLEHLDAAIQATRKDGGLDRASGALTVR